MAVSYALLRDGIALLDADRLIRAGIADRRVSLELCFDEMPSHAGFLVVAGLEDARDALERARLEEAQVLAAKRVIGFSDELERRLARAALTVDIDAVPDGTIAFAGTPVATVEGPFVEVVLVAALIMPAIRRGTAVATRAARLHVAAGGGLIVDASAARATLPGEALAIGRAAHVGGAAATTSSIVASKLGLPFRGEPRIDLGPLSPVEARSDEGWGPPSKDRLFHLGGRDEEALLVEAKRRGVTAGGWMAAGLADEGAAPITVRSALVALEEGGAWVPRRGASDREEVVSGRKRVARCFDAAGRAVADIVHLVHERMRAPRALGAAKLVPLARPILRHGRALEAPEPPRAGRERAISTRQLLPHAVVHLRAPARYRIELSPGVIALRDAAGAPPAAQG